MKLTIATFHEYCLANPTLELPEYDCLGVLYGSRYQPTRKSTDNKKRRVGNSLDIKSRLITHYESPLDEIFDLNLMFSPYPAAVRPSYPMVFEQQFLEKLKTGDRLMKKDINTIGRVITVILKDTGQPHLHAVCLLPENKWFQRESIERMYREMDYARKFGMTWELLGTGWIKEYTGVNLATMHSWCCRCEIHRHKYEAYEFALTLCPLIEEGNMDCVVRYVENQMNLEEDCGYMIFAIAAAYGFLRVDHEYELNRRRRIHLEQ